MVRFKYVLLFLALILLFLVSAFVFTTTRVLAVDVPDYCQQNPIPSDKVNECIPILTDKGSELRAQSNSLSSQIGIMNNQISLTQLKIQAAQAQLAEMEKDIEVTKQRTKDLEKNISETTKALIGRIGATYQVGRIDPWQIFLTSNNISNFFTRLTYLRLVQTNDRKNIYAAQQDKANYQNEKAVLEEKQKAEEAVKAQLVDYTNQLSQDKTAKQTLLDQTRGSEANYQSLLAKARAQLSAFSGYSQSVGTELVSHQDLSDGWGKYFNQRDSQWGNLLVNNDNTNCRGGPCTLARIGCLVTSYAMMSSHFGGSVTPADVAVNSGNFSVSSADFNRPGPSANGHSVSYVADPSVQQLRDALNSGKAVIAGLSMDGGPSSTHYSDHWVVLKSVDGDSFKINDPEYAGAMDKSLNDHYSSWTIIEARIYD